MYCDGQVVQHVGQHEFATSDSRRQEDLGERARRVQRALEFMRANPDHDSWGLLLDRICAVDAETVMWLVGRCNNQGGSVWPHSHARAGLDRQSTCVWRQNQYGQLGTSTGIPTPVSHVAILTHSHSTPPASSARLAAMSTASSGMAPALPASLQTPIITTTGTLSGRTITAVTCGSGQLGDGTTTSKSTPVIAILHCIPCRMRCSASG
jgi:hypothetical protein